MIQFMRRLLQPRHLARGVATSLGVVATLSGIMVLGAATAASAPSQASSTCVVNLLGVCVVTPAPIPVPTAVPTAVPTLPIPAVKLPVPTPSLPITIPSTPAIPSVPPLPVTLPPLPVAPAATPTPGPGICLVNCGLGSVGGSPCVASLLNQCAVSTGGTSTPSGTCVVNCGVASVGGGCAVSLLQGCVLPGGSPTPPSGTCLPGNLVCLGGTGCTAAVQSNCVVPGVQGVTPPTTNNPSPGSSPGSNPTNGSQNGTGTSSGGSASQAGSLAGAGSLGLPSGGPGGGGSSTPAALDLRAVPVSQDLGPLAGLAFGHALVLLPLFAALDALALLALIGVLRRSWAAKLAD